MALSIEVAITLTSLAQAHGALGEYELSEAVSARALRLAGSALQSPNALLAEMGLFASLAAKAAGKTCEAQEMWEKAFDELVGAVGDTTANAKVQTFTAHALRSWRAARRVDVANWLLGIDSQEQQ